MNRTPWRLRPSRWVPPLVAMALAAGVLGAPRQSATAATAPNVVLILTDDMRWDQMWAMPNVQSLIVDHGVSFSNSFVTASLCCPSRASILSGQYPHSDGVYKNAPPNGGWSSFDATSTLATWLQGGGYQTALMGKYLNGYDFEPYIGPGWNRWFVSTTDSLGGFEYYNYTMSDQGTSVSYGSDPQDYSTDVLSSQADTWIRAQDPAKPVFLYLSVAAPHQPATPGPQYVSSFSSLAPSRPPGYNELDDTDKPKWVQRLDLMDQASQDDTDAFRVDQYRTLLSVDDTVSTLVQTLTDTGRLSNTMIVFASDNGYSWGEHRRWQQKSNPYEENIRVPLVIRYDPLTATPRTDEHLVTNIDWAPTFAELAGVDSPGVDGVSLMPLIRGDQVTWRTDFATEHLQGWSNDIPSYCGVRGEGYSYVKYATGEEELYDLAADPYQLGNAAKDPSYATVLAQMRARAPILCDPPPPGMTFASTPPTVTIGSGPAALTSSTSATFTFSADESGVRFQCGLDGAVPTTCTSAVTYTGLTATNHFFSVIGTDPQGFIGSAAWHWAVALPVTAADFTFTPAVVKPGQGTTVLWTFNGLSNHTVTDSTGMGLFDSGPMGPGTTFSYPFAAAGIYSYQCAIHPTQMNGQVKAPMILSPQTGSLTTWFTIRWASTDAPSGFAYEVQIKRPGSTRWTTWTSGTSAFSMFQADGGTGTYSFRARIKNTANSKASGWSVTKSIMVDP